jgi:lipid A 3-O-deacylase
MKETNLKTKRVSLKPGRLRSALTIVCAMTLISLMRDSALSQTPMTNATANTTLELKPASNDIWQNGIGEGFKPGVQSISFSSGGGYGLKILGSQANNDLALASLSYGYMLGPVQGEGHWYRGNWEFRGELFSGAQFSPRSDWVVGLTPHLRYNFATGTRWVPYLDAGAGVTATSIGPPDLSHTFEFNLQAATGVRWFLKENFALSAEVRYLHFSCASIDSPNLGLNNIGGMVGFSWFFGKHK